VQLRERPALALGERVDRRENAVMRPFFSSSSVLATSGSSLIALRAVGISSGFESFSDTAL
jgi:hypothetical protein